MIYTPGGEQWAKAWTAFYSDDNKESQISIPLTKAGPEMIPAILEAIAHKDMKYRRYAIGALGNLRSASALGPLTAIVEDEDRLAYCVFSTWMKASCGMLIRPMLFIRFFPSFCFSSSLRLRLMSPP